MKPRRNCFSMSRTLFSVASMRVFFASGTVMSAMEIVIAP